MAEPKKPKAGEKRGDYAPAWSIKLAFAILFFLILFVYIVSSENKFRSAAMWVWDGIIEMLRRAIGV